MYVPPSLQKCLRVPMVGILCFLMGMGLPTPKVGAEPTSVQLSQAQNAKAIIEAAQRRVVNGFNSHEEELAFEELVRANVVTQLVDDPVGFLVYWKANKTALLKATSVPDQRPINWQMFLAQIYIKYKIEKTNASVHPQQFIVWLETVVSNPWVEWASLKTWLAVLGAYVFARGVVKGALIAGPAAGAINAALNPIMTPVNQKLTVIGNKNLGPTGMRIYSWLFDGPTKVSAKDMAEAKEAISGVRALVEGRTYHISNEQWTSNMKSLYKLWNLLNFQFNLVPDAYKGGRDRAYDLLISRPIFFAGAVTTSINAVETHRQGVDVILNHLILRGANARAVGLLTLEIQKNTEEQIRVERDHPDRPVENSPAVEKNRGELIKLGASAEQADRVIENFRRVHVFTGQAATFMAGQKLNDAMYSDTIQAAKDMFSELSNRYSTAYFNIQLKHAIVEILDRLEFKMGVRQAVAESGIAPAQTGDRALRAVSEMTTSTAGARAVNEPGSVSKPPAQTGAERAREAAGRTGRR